MPTNTATQLMDAQHRDRFLNDGYTRVDGLIDDQELCQLAEIYDLLFSRNA